MLIFALPAGAQDFCPVELSGSGTAANAAYRIQNDVTIPVVFHVITGTGGVGNVTDAQIAQQIAVLEAAFEPPGPGGPCILDTRFHFELIGVGRVQNQAWFTGMDYADPSMTADDEVKQALSVDPAHVLNIYTAELPGSLRGYSTYPFPATYPGGVYVDTEDSFWHGVVLDYTVLPGGGASGRDLGDVAVHEAGHYLGLYHTSTGACSGSTPQTCASDGDHVCDTPQHRIQTFVCEADPAECGDGPTPIHNYLNSTPDACMTQFTAGQYTRMRDLTGEFRPSLGGTPGLERVSPDVTLTLEPDVELLLTQDVQVEAGGSLLVQDGGLWRFAQGSSLNALGQVDAEGATFTEAASGQGWDGIRVAGDDGSLDFDGVIVEHAEVGIEIRSETNTIKNTLLTDNGVGILADSYQNGLLPGLSGFHLRESCVVNSVFDDTQPGFEGHGIWGRWTNAFIVNTTVEDNDGYGVSFENADLFIAHGLLVTDNGSTASGFMDGVRSGPNGDVTLASPFGGSGFDVGPERNSIHDNEQDQIFIDENGYATVGALCTSLLGGGCPTTNRVSEGGFPGDGDFLIANEPNTTIPAQRVYWATPFPNPPDAAFLQPTLVDDGSAISSDPASDAGRTLGCAPSTFLSGGSGMGRSASAASRAAQAFGGGSSGEGRELDPETAAWLRARLRAMRAALAENPAADTSAALLGRLYDLQRLDRTDALGEHTATMGLLASLRARLMGEGSLPPALRATAEAALVAGVHDLMRGEDYEAARTVVSALAPRTEAERTRLAMALADASLDEVGGDYASAIGKYEGIIEALGPEHAQLARDLRATVALLEGRLNGGDLRTGNPTGEAPAVQAAMGEAPSTFGLGSAYPNPFNPVAVVPFTLASSSEVVVTVYDVLGRRVALLADGRFEAGSHTLRFDASALPSGTYLVRMAATPESGAARTFTRRITLLR